LLLALTTSLGGTWLLEQPENSVLEFFPPFITLLAAMFRAYGDTAVANLDYGQPIFFQLSFGNCFMDCSSVLING